MLYDRIRRLFKNNGNIIHFIIWNTDGIKVALKMIKRRMIILIKIIFLKNIANDAKNIELLINQSISIKFQRRIV